MIRVLYAFNIALALLFAGAFALLTLAPKYVERHVRDQLVQRIATAALERYPNLTAGSWPDAISSELLSEVAALREERNSPKLDALAAVLAAVCRYDCGDPERIATSLRRRISERLVGIDTALRRVEAWAQDRYQALIGELIADLKIFTATNTVLCALAAVATLRANGGARLRLALSAVLLGSALIGAWLYVFSQNWLQTLLFADYVGYGYLVWVALIGAALSDIAFNQGRVVQALGDAVSRFADGS